MAGCFGIGGAPRHLLKTLSDPACAGFSAVPRDMVASHRRPKVSTVLLQIKKNKGGGPYDTILPPTEIDLTLIAQRRSLITEVIMPKPGSGSLSLATLGETVDLLAVVVARMSEKLDQHGETLAAFQNTSLESRDATQAAKAYADPQRYGRYIGNEIDRAPAVLLDLLEGLHLGLAADRRDTSRTMDELVRQEEQTLQRLPDDLARAGRRKKRAPFIAYSAWSWCLV